MKELVVHLRKDLKMLSSDSIFLISMIVLTVMAFVMAFESSWSYVDGSFSYYSTLTTKYIIERKQVSTLEEYWIGLCSLYTILLTMISSMLLTSEKESGMMSYILTLRTRKWRFFLSKFTIVLGVSTLIAVVSMLAYLIVFSALDVPFLGVDDVLASMLLPFLTILIFCAIGLAVSALVKKRSAAIALSVVIWLVVSLGYVSVTSMAESVAYDDPNFDYETDEWIDFVPFGYKLLIYANPLVLVNGQGDYLDMTGGAILGACMMVAYLALGLVLFAREGTEQGVIKDLIKKVRRKEKGTPKQ
jgi:ABC-type transport system involved in multi-copper enzyme maturation permease subunit